MNEWNSDKRDRNKFPTIPPFPNPIKPTEGEVKALLREIERKEKEFKEFITDALQSSRVVGREMNFILDLNKGMQRGLITTFEDLSNRQLFWAKDIKRRVYSVG